MLPAPLEALLLTSDLQGVAPRPGGDGAVALLGQTLAEELPLLAELGLIPARDRIGVVLAGDLFSDMGARERGASGDVREVWRAFAHACRWVAGVAGNHDFFAAREGEGRPRRSGEGQRLAGDDARFGREPGMRLLDGDVVELDGLLVGGVGGIIGDSAKPRRRSPEDFVGRLRGVLARHPGLVVLHQGPSLREQRRIGHDAVREALEGTGRLVVCGHAHWAEPLAQLPRGPQVLNVDGRAVLLRRA